MVQLTCEQRTASASQNAARLPMAYGAIRSA
jgi:hypothetical protein